MKELVQNLQTNSQALPCPMIWFHPDNFESGGKCGFAQY